MMDENEPTAFRLKAVTAILDTALPNPRARAWDSGLVERTAPRS